MIHAPNMLKALTAAMLFASSASAQTCADLSALTEAAQESAPVEQRLPGAFEVTEGACAQSECGQIRDAPGGIYEEGCDDACCLSIEVDGAPTQCENVCASNAIEAAAAAQQAAGSSVPEAAAAAAEAGGPDAADAVTTAAETPLDAEAPAEDDGTRAIGGASTAPAPAPTSSSTSAGGGAGTTARAPSGSSSSGGGGGESAAAPDSGDAASWSAGGACFAAAIAGILTLA